MKMYQLYTNKEDSLPVTQCVFRRVFKEHEPPLAIFKPEKDQCCIFNAAERTKTQAQMTNIENTL